MTDVEVIGISCRSLQTIEQEIRPQMRAKVADRLEETSQRLLAQRALETDTELATRSL